MLHEPQFIAQLVNVWEVIFDHAENVSPGVLSHLVHFAIQVSRRLPSGCTSTMQNRSVTIPVRPPQELRRSVDSLELEKDYLT